MLVRLFSNGKAENIRFHKEDEKIVIEFDYINNENDNLCKVKYDFKFRPDRPRKVAFSINNREFTREIGENYSQRLITEGKSIGIEDPFVVSIRRFVDAVAGGAPLISEKEILENMKLQDELIKEYLGFKND